MSDGTIVTFDAAGNSLTGSGTGASGGLATKNAPLRVQPNSMLLLDNVRQERKNEWRTRGGNTHNVADDLPGGNVPVLLTEAPWGGLVGLCRQTDATTGGRIYSPNAGSRWITPPVVGTQRACSQQTPSSWTRSTAGPSIVGNQTLSQMATAQGGNYRLTAWWVGTAGAPTSIQVTLQTLDGATAQYFAQFNGDGFAYRPRVVYSSLANRLVMFYMDINNHLIATSWDATTGVQAAAPTTLATNGWASDFQQAYLDAVWYGGTTITVAYRNSTGTGNLEIVEYNPATNTPTLYPQTVDCSKALALFPDPDASGIRTVGVGTATPEARVIRLNSTGTIQTNDLAEALDPVYISGVVYNAGADWMCVYQHNAIGVGLRAVKKRTGSVSAPAVLAVGGGMTITFAAGAWREPGTDTMRYMILVTGAAADDPQPTFLEMGLEFENGAATISNYWPESQSRLLPLNAGSGTKRGGVAQVQRLGTDRFLMPLGRITEITDPSDGFFGGPQFAVDTWTVQYLNGATYTNQNIGKGTQTQQSAFLPSGSLLQTGTGQLICAHGSSAIPFEITSLTQSVGLGSLVPGKKYVYGVTVSMPDENGNVWRSPMSAQLAATMTGSNNTIVVAGSLTPFENQLRRRVVMFWRTDGDAETFKLLHVIDDTVANTISYSITDATDDVDTGEEYPFQLPGDTSGELQATLTPRLIHPTNWDGRLWGIDGDFPSRVRYSKPLTTGILPEFPEDFVIEIDDALGPGTGLAAMDDKICLFKQNAIYVAGGDGPENDGTGATFSFQLISSETGAIAGAPLLSTGSEVYMVSLGGIFRLKRSQETDFVGSSIDRYLSMPLLTSPETVTGMYLSSPKNEVRIQTTNYRFVHDRIYDIWERDTGIMAGAYGIVLTRGVGTDQVFLTSSGQMYFEASDSNTPDDCGIAYQGSLRCPWMRPSNMEGWLTIRHLRALAECTSAGATSAPLIALYFDNDDTIVEYFAPRYTLGATGPIRADCKPRKQLCSAFSPQLTLPSGNATIRFDAWSALVSAAPAMQALTNRDNWAPSSGAPSGLTPPGSPLFWFKADAGVTMGATGLVTAWADQTTNHFDIACVDAFGNPLPAGFQPQFTAGAINGLPALDWGLWIPGVSGRAMQFVTATPNLPLVAGAARTVLAVVMPKTGTGATGGILCSFRRTSTDFECLMQDTGSAQYGASNLISQIYTLSSRVNYANQAILCDWEWPGGGTAPTVNVNGANRPGSVGGGAMNADNGTSGFSIGWEGAQGVNVAAWSGLIAEVICYAGTDPLIVAAARAYLKLKWGL